MLSEEVIRFDVTSAGAAVPLGEVVNRRVPPTTVTVTTTLTPPPNTVTNTTTETPEPKTSTVTTTPPTVTTTLPPSTVVTTVTPPTVTETPKTETTTATTEVTTAVTTTPETKTTTLPPVTETVTTTETPEPKTSTEVVPTTVVTTEPGTTEVKTTTSTVTAPPATVAEAEGCDCTPTTVTVPPKTVTVTPPLVTDTVTKEVPTTVVKDKTKVVEVPPVTVTETPEKATVTVKAPGEPTTVRETVTETPEQPTPDVPAVVEEPTPNAPVVDTPDTPVIPGAFSGTVVWDEDRSKSVNDGDERIPGLTVVAYKDGKEIARTTTDENGFYKFDNLEPGEYGIAVYGPDGGELFFEDKSATVVAGEEDTGNDWASSARTRLPRHRRSLPPRLRLCERPLPPPARTPMHWLAWVQSWRLWSHWLR